jgi:hypothetical protein
VRGGQANVVHEKTEDGGLEGAVEGEIAPAEEEGSSGVER